MKKIAITGNIGCGKSYVIHHLLKSGVFCVDCDQIAKQVREENIDDIYQTFQVNSKEELRNLVFKDDKKRIQLEKIIHPLVFKELENIYEIHKDLDLIVVEVPLLYEINWQSHFDEVWVVYTKEETALERLKKYRNINEEKARSILKKQMSLDEKVKKANKVIYNNENDDVKGQIDLLLKGEKI